MSEREAHRATLSSAFEAERELAEAKTRIEALEGALREIAKYQHHSADTSGSVSVLQNIARAALAGEPEDSWGTGKSNRELLAEMESEPPTTNSDTAMARGRRPLWPDEGDDVWPQPQIPSGEPEPPTTCPTCGSDDRRKLLNPCVRMQEYQVIDGYGDGPDPWHTVPTDREDNE